MHCPLSCTWLQETLLLAKASRLGTITLHLKAASSTEVMWPDKRGVRQVHEVGTDSVATLLFFAASFSHWQSRYARIMLSR